jgi:hypothetical protein
MWSQGKIEKFWDDEFKNLNYKREIFNNQSDIENWRNLGYKQDVELFSGMMCPFGENHPIWTDKFVKYVEENLGLKDIGVCYYRMETGVILPTHSDHYNVYRKKFNLELNQIHRVLIFLEDWKSGHYFEVDGQPFFNYKAGTFVAWYGNTKHMAANIGQDMRYTLQLTGWK